MLLVYDPLIKIIFDVCIYKCKCKMASAKVIQGFSNFNILIDFYIYYLVVPGHGGRKGAEETLDLITSTTS